MLVTVIPAGNKSELYNLYADLYSLEAGIMIEWMIFILSSWPDGMISSTDDYSA